MVVNKSGKKSVKTGAKTSSGTTRKKKVLSYEIGELDHYLFGQETIMRFIKSWVRMK